MKQEYRNKQEDGSRESGVGRYETSEFILKKQL